jgi:hypothetical protein
MFMSNLVRYRCIRAVVGGAQVILLAILDNKASHLHQTGPPFVRMAIRGHPYRLELTEGVLTPKNGTKLIRLGMTGIPRQFDCVRFCNRPGNIHTI